MNWIQKYLIAIPAGLVYALILFFLLCTVGGIGAGIVAALTNYIDDNLYSAIIAFFMVVSAIAWIPITWWIARFLTMDMKKATTIKPTSTEVLH